MSAPQHGEDTSSEESTAIPKVFAPPTAAKAAKQNPTPVVLAIIALIISLMSFVLGAYAIYATQESDSLPTRSASSGSQESYYSQPDDLENFIATAEKSIVEILCNGTGSGFAFDIEPEEAEFGTVIVSNFHVIEDCIDNPDTIEVYTLNQYETKAKLRVRGFDKDADLVLLEIEEKLPRMYASEYFAERGWWTMAIGNPVDTYFEDEEDWATLYNATTFGQISYVLNEFWNYTSATINGGNSGGPLLDNRGNVIGINTLAGASTEGGVWNIAVDTAILCEKLIECE